MVTAVELFVLSASLRRLASSRAKKNVRSLTIAPPTLPPNWLCTNLGVSVSPARLFVRLSGSIQLPR